MLQFAVPANTWFAAGCDLKSRFVLTGCTVAPGFEFAHFEMAVKEILVKQYPAHKEIIERLYR